MLMRRDEKCKSYIAKNGQYWLIAGGYRIIHVFLRLRGFAASRL